jgi:acetoin utilization protein AcuB
MSDFAKVKISEVMTRAPRSIEPHLSLDVARTWMDELKVRHLPVREAGKVVGIISDRDLGLMTGLKAKFSTFKVEDAMISGVRTVAETSSVVEVAKEMLDHRIGSILVTGKDGALLGIFTDADALRVLAGRV